MTKIVNLFIWLYSFLQSISGFRKFGYGTVIKFPYKVWSKNFIEVGSNVFIAENSFLAVSARYNNVNYAPKLKIGDNVCIGSNFFVACIDEVIIENDVLISDRVFICDHIHGYKDIQIPIINQNLKMGGRVLIKRGSFIGINAVIMPGITIGKNSVVGASSVVTKDIPDNTVVVGNPGKIIKRYNERVKKWEKVK